MKNLKVLMMAFISSMLFVSCIVDDEDEYLDGLSNTPYTIGFQKSVAVESYFSDTGAIEKSYPVVIIGGKDGSNPTTDIAVQYTVNTELSTAVEGQEFNFTDNSGTLIIPAGSDFANFNILVNTGGLDPDAPTKLVLDLTSANSSNEKAVVADSRKRIEITFVGCQSNVAKPDEAVTYHLEMTSARGNASYDEEISWTGPNQFKTSSVGYWGKGWVGCSCFNFEVVCGEVFVPDQSLADYYSNEVAGINPDGPDGFVDPETGDISITYTVVLGGSPVIFTSKYTRLD